MTRTAWTVVFLGILAALIAVVGALGLESTPPVITGPEALLVGGAGATVEFDVVEGRSGLRSVKAVLEHSAGEKVLFEETYEASLLPLVGARTASQHLELALQPRDDGLGEGDAVLRITARDASWRSGLRGNEGVLEIPVKLDFWPPHIQGAQAMTHMFRGGSALYVFAVDEDAPEIGASFDGVTYPSYLVRASENAEASPPAEPQTEKAKRAAAKRKRRGPLRVALVPFPVEASDKPRPGYIARDEAGNRTWKSARVKIHERNFPETPIHLSENFLQNKVVNLAEELRVDATDPVAAFDEINTRVRAENEARIREIVEQTAPEPLFRGAFQQMKNTKVTSGFADRRVYLVDSEPVSRATHYGYDLASTSGAPVTASNTGRVLFAGDLGIYGLCVILDHGIGLSSLYGHLSDIEVQVGDEVAKGDVLGSSGETGLAGGDHLHFAILVHGEYVDPLEWWDKRWVSANVTARIAAAAKR